MKFGKQKIKQFFFERNGDFKFWLVMVINYWLLILAIWVLLEISR